MRSARRNFFKRAVALGAIGLGVFATGHALASAPPGFIADPKSGCKIFNPDPFVMSDLREAATGVPSPDASPTVTTISWGGPCKDGYADGRGVLQWIEGGHVVGRTEGEFHKGMLFGRALTVYDDGRRAEGEYSAGKLNGRGVLTFSDRSRFDGEFKDNRPNGKGKAVDARGNRYEGGFQDGRREGFGIFLGADGSRYDGNWSVGVRDGHGVFIWPDGRRYEGDWSANRPDGEGTYWNQSGEQFTGIWDDGCLETDTAYAVVFRTMESCGYE